MTLLFPGQGSQFPGMGEALFPKYAPLIAEADEVLGYPISEVCLGGFEKLRQTNYTQPAIFLVSVMMYHEYCELWNYPYIHSLMGHSLGEYTALYVSGAFDFKTGLQLVKKRGELMQMSKNGTMAAVVGMSATEVQQLLEREKKDVYIANLNLPTQLVLAGNEVDIQYLQKVFTDNGKVNYHILPVNGAFHSPYMTGAAQEFGQYLESYTFSEPKQPVIANWNSELYTAANIKENLTKQIDHPVLWDDGIQKLKDAGETFFVEAGPKNVLSRLMKAPTA
jgi:malonyl CoA-acyl carrier protein transacylase